MLDVIFKFAAEVFDEALHRPGRGVTQRADRAAFDVGGDVRQQVEVPGVSPDLSSRLTYALPSASNLFLKYSMVWLSPVLKSISGCQLS